MLGKQRLSVLIYMALGVLTGCVGLAPVMSHQGRLLDASGNPVPDGDYEVNYAIYQAETGGTAVYTETQTVNVQDGLFTTSIGLSSLIDPTVFAGPTWLEVSVGGEVLTPRQRMQGAPFAFSLATGSVVQGIQTIDREFAGQTETGAALTVINADTSATGGHGLLAINRAAAAGVDRDKVAALQGRALGGVTADGTGSYGAIITSEAYRGMYAKGGTNYYAAVFDSNAGIELVGGGTCSGCALMYYGQNAGAAPIRAGDLVAVDGVVVDADLNIPVMQVRKATSPADAVIGVATGAAARRPIGEFNGVTTGGFEATAGSAAQGGYVRVVVQGLVQARAAGTSLQPGTAVSAGVDGVVADRGGRYQALSAVDENGMVWVMVGGQ
jgi:hypothetical protein